MSYLWEKAEQMPQTPAILAMISSCGGGDWPPLLALSIKLQNRGHQVVVLCDADTRKAVHMAGLQPITLPAWLNLNRYFTPVLQRILDSGAKLTAATTNPMEQWAIDVQSYLLTKLGEWRPTLLLSSLFCLQLGRTLANRFQLPWCFVNPSFYFGSQGVLFQENDFSPTGARMYRHWLLPPQDDASLVLHATDSLFDAVHPPLPSHHHYIGPLFWEMETAIPAWFNEAGPPWLILSLSTSPQKRDLEIVTSTLKACCSKRLRTTPYRILITLPGHPIAEKHSLTSFIRTLPAELPHKIYVSGYFPHSIALAKAALSVSHAGHGMVMKSLYQGTPMVLVPWGRDQPGVAVRAKAITGASIIEPQACNPARLAEAICDILSNRGANQKIAWESRRLQEIDTAASAYSRLENLL